MELANRQDFIEIPAVDGRNGACYAMPSGFPRGRNVPFIGAAERVEIAAKSGRLSRGHS
jgi:hypothetical protein